MHVNTDADAGGSFRFLNEVVELPLIFPSSRAAALTHMALYEKYPELQAEFKGVKVLGDPTPARRGRRGPRR